MGSSKYTFIGAFLAFTELPSEVKPQTNTTKTVTCDNGTCKNYNKVINAKFCPECGQPAKIDVQKTTVDVTITKSDYELVEEFGDENLFFRYEGLLLPNRRLKNCITIDESSDDIMNCPVKEDAIQEFYDNYHKFLLFLDAYPLKLQYEIRFGIINYWN